MSKKVYIFNAANYCFRTESFDCFASIFGACDDGYVLSRLDECFYNEFAYVAD